jgi:Glycosyltransferase family 87
MHRIVDGLFALPLATRFLLLALIGVPLLPPILAYGLWIDHWPVAKSGHPAFDDLSNLWLGAKAAASGDYTNLFRRELHEAMIAREFGALKTNQVWSYPPTIMVLLKPLGLLPSYAWFVVLWVGAGLALLTAALFSGNRSPASTNSRVTANQAWSSQVWVWMAVILTPGTMLCINAGQTGMLTSAVLYFGLLFAVARPVLAGAIMALLVAKPHLGLALPVALLALGAYRAVVSTGIWAAMYVGLTFVVLGPEPWHQFLSVTLPEHVHYVDTVSAGPDEALKITMFMLLRAVGFSKVAAMSTHVLLSLSVVAVMAATLRATTNQSLRFLVVALATLLISPYLLGYEVVLAALAIGRVVLDREALRALGSATVAALCVGLTVGHMGAIFIAAPHGLNPTALIVLAAFVAVTRRPTLQAARHGIAWGIGWGRARLRPKVA